jgi:high-affinity K+ transport system ATPase subunit B
MRESAGGMLSMSAFATGIDVRNSEQRRSTLQGIAMILVLISVLIIIVVGAICFWAIDRFAIDRRLANLLKLLVVLICLGAILQRVLPMTGIY